MLKIVIGTNEGKVLCISNNEDKIKASMVDYLIDTDQEPTEDFFESRNWGEYDIEVYEYQQPQLNPNQLIVLEWLKEEQTKNPELSIFGTLSVLFDESENRFMNLDVIDALNDLSNSQQAGVFQAFSKWALEQEEE